MVIKHTARPLFIEERKDLNESVIIFLSSEPFRIEITEGLNNDPQLSMIRLNGTGISIPFTNQMQFQIDSLLVSAREVWRNDFLPPFTKLNW